MISFHASRKVKIKPSFVDVFKSQELMEVIKKHDTGIVFKLSRCNKDLHKFFDSDRTIKYLKVFTHKKTAGLIGKYLLTEAYKLGCCNKHLKKLCAAVQSNWKWPQLFSSPDKPLLEHVHTYLLNKVYPHRDAVQLLRPDSLPLEVKLEIYRADKPYDLACSVVVPAKTWGELGVEIVKVSWSEPVKEYGQFRIKVRFFLKNMNNDGTGWVAIRLTTSVYDTSEEVPVAGQVLEDANVIRHSMS